MAFHFFYFLLSSIFFLPSIRCLCWDSPGHCGHINISHPFSLSNTPSPGSPSADNDPKPGTPNQHADPCEGITHMISCDEGHNTNPVAKIEIGERPYVVVNISYPDKILTVQDPTFQANSHTVPCGFFLKFVNPLYDYDGFLHYCQSQDFKHSPPGCGLGSSISQSLSTEPYNSTDCSDYSLYYWTEADQHDVAHSCKSNEITVEMTLSFSDGGQLSLLSIGFSQHVQLREDCFNCGAGDESCPSNKGPVNSTCSCRTTCKKKSGSQRGKIIGIAVGVVGGFFILCSLAIFICNRRKRHQQFGLSGLLSWSSSSKISSKKDPEIGESKYHTHVFSYEELEEATDGFNASRELGDGGFGTVYKGKLRDGRTVAVKRLYEHNYRRLEQFMNEVEILSRLRHKYLVTLYGCTSRHSRELLLVYEYIPNGTVADHLHGSLASESGALSWPIRLSIAIETAEALDYLHAVEPQIIHRDVKTNNILLDSDFHVKVADFGLSRLFPLDATHVSTAPQGTPGYVDPEYHQCYQLTDKSDVYSFGVVLIELISSKPAVDISRHRHEINLANLAVNKIQNRQLDQLVDPELGYDIDSEVKRMIDQVAELAFRCLQSDGDMRPGIREVLEMLRVIERGHKEEREGDGSEIQMKEESRLLNSAVPFSPDSVTSRWPSNSTTPHTST